MSNANSSEPTAKYPPLLHIVLYAPEIHYNTGNIGRTCVAVGAKLWLVKPLGFSVDDYYLRRAGLDYWEMLDWEVVEDWKSLTERLVGHRFWYLTKFAKNDYSQAKYEREDVFVFGSESKGLPAELIEAVQAQALRIPMRDDVRCLNLSNVAAIMMYEAIRQGVTTPDIR
jgi:tRNA (cytidine/uridine-2'-O-)-methyltransferase